MRKVRLRKIHRQVKAKSMRNLGLKLLRNGLPVEKHQEIEDRRLYKKQSPNLKMRQAVDRIYWHEMLDIIF